MDSFSFAIVALVLWMLLAYTVSLIRANNSVADMAYGGAYVVMVSAAFIAGMGQGSTPQILAVKTLLIVLIALWAVRLTLRIARRGWNAPEDFRYRAWREQWTWVKTRSFFQVYALQGAIIAAVGFPSVLAMGYAGSIMIWPLVIWGGATAVFGLIVEHTADTQADRWRQNPENHGKLLTTGLRKWVRHPQYWGESVFWWGIAFIVVALVGPNPTSLLLLWSPLLIMLLLRYVSGVPLLDARLSKYPGWKEYSQKTPAMFYLWRRSKNR